MGESPFRPCICVPTYDNPVTIGDVVAGCLRATDAPVLVVDDASARPVENLLPADPRLSLVRHAQNRGKGAALVTAFRWAAARGFTHVLAIDADGQHYPSEIPRLLAAAAAEPDSLVVGARDMHAGNSPALSRLGRFLSNAWVYLATGTYLADSQSGMRVYPLAAVNRHHYGSERYDFELEVILRLFWSGVGCRAVPMPVHYPKASERVSHFHVVKDNLRIVRTSARVFLAWVFKGKRGGAG